MTAPQDLAEGAIQTGVAAFTAAEKISAEFFAISYGALVRQMIDDLPQEDDVEAVNEQLAAVGHRIGARLVEEFSMRSGAPPCRSFAQAAERVALVGFRMFLNLHAEVAPVKDSADAFSITFYDNPLALFVELPPGPLGEQLWYSNILCGAIAGALTIVGFRCEVRFVCDKLRGDPKNEITICFKGRERETFHVEENAEEKEKWQRAIIILEHCPLQSIQTERGFELLSERHRSYHARHQQDPAEWRPDVVHQCLLHLQDSPLNRAGKLEVFLRTKKGICIAVDPRLHVPRHMRLFEKMMVTLLFKMRVRSSAGYLSLLRVVRNPITDHVPAHTVLYRVERDGELVGAFDFCAGLARGGARNPGEAENNNNKNNKGNDSNGNGNDNSDARSAKALASAEAGSAAFAEARREAAAAHRFRPFALIVGGMSKGDVDVAYAPKGQVRSVRLGERGMSAAAVLSELLHGLEEVWLREDNEAG